MNDQVVTALVAAVPTIAVGWLVYKGGRQTAAESNVVAADALDVDERDRAVDAWRSMVETLLKPMQARIDQQEKDLDTERSARISASRSHRRELALQREKIEKLTREVETWQRAAKVLAKWGTSLRDEVLRLGGRVPATPDELLTLHAIEDAQEYRRDHDPHQPAQPREE